MRVVGIDFGTSCARVATVGRGAPSLVTDGGATDLPVHVWLSGNDLVAGPLPQRAPGSDPPPALRGLKRVLAREADDALVRAFAERTGLAVEAGHQAAALVSLPDRKWALEQIVALVFGHLAQTAAARLGDWPERMVLGMPPWFDDRQRAALRDSATVAGLQVERTLLEPTAIALGVLPPGDQERRVAVVDVGAGGASAAVIVMDSQALRLVGVAADAHAGGDDVDAELLGQALAQLAEQMPLVPCDPASLDALRAVCASMKHDLTRAETARRSLTEFDPPEPGAPHPTLAFDRVRLDSLTADLSSRVDRLCTQALSGAGLRAGAVDLLLLAGGTSAVPSVRARIRAAVNARATQNAPAGSVALGAARLACMLDGTAPPLAIDEGDDEDRPSRVGVVFAPERPSYDAGLPPPSMRTATPALSFSPRSSGPASPPPSSPGSPPARTTTGSQGVPRQVGSGSIVNPRTAKATLDLALARPLGDADLEPIAIAVLLARLMPRRSVTGTLVVRESGGERITTLVMQEGLGYAKKAEHLDLIKSFAWPEGSYAFEPGAAGTADRDRFGMPRLAMAGLRYATRGCGQDEIERALGDRLDLSPRVRADRAEALKRLGLVAPEARLVQFGLDPSKTGRAVAPPGSHGRQATLQALLLLTAFECIEWVPPRAEQSESLEQRMDRRAREMEEGDYFDVLGVHWAATDEDIEVAYRRAVDELVPGSAASMAAPAACKRMLTRIELAYGILRDARGRADYRATLRASATAAGSLPPGAKAR